MFYLGFYSYYMVDLGFKWVFDSGFSSNFILEIVILLFFFLLLKDLLVLVFLGYGKVKRRMIIYFC